MFSSIARYFDLWVTNLTRAVS